MANLLAEQQQQQPFENNNQYPPEMEGIEVRTNSIKKGSILLGYLTPVIEYDWSFEILLEKCLKVCY